ncbi:MAG: LolA family protein [Acetivibrionales bacterium]
MSKKEKKLSAYIDRLNAEKKPFENEHEKNDNELGRLFGTIRLVRSLKEPAMPEEGYYKKLTKSISDSLSDKKPPKTKRRTWKACLAAVAAVMVFAVLFNFFIPLGNTNIVSAMEKAYKGIKAYHGIIAIEEMNQEGNSFLQAKVEVWKDKDGRYYARQLEGSQKGLITANNGVMKWQLRPDEKQAYIFSAFPDPYIYAFELGKEIEDVNNAVESRIIGEEDILGRKTAILEVTPEGGQPYKLWIDKETKLPLQKQTAMHNALQYKVAYIQIAFNGSIQEELMTYSLPEGFEEINTSPEQIVNGLEEAVETVGFYPDIPDTSPEYKLENISVNVSANAIILNYASQDSSKRAAIIERKADRAFEIASAAVMGKVGDNAAEIQSPVMQGAGILGIGAYAGLTDINSIRWQRGNMEYAVIGNIPIDKIIEIVNSLKHGDVEVPENYEMNFNPQFRPQVDVTADMEIERNEQKSVDAGHSPWRLDHEFVAQVFASLKISPEGIMGEYPIREDQLKTIYNSGTEAIVEVAGEKTVVKRVYLKRLVRQDPTGIWTVVGYDPA